MKKVLFTSILLLSAVSFGGNIYAQETADGNDTEVTTPIESSASVEFKASEDGKTLTISGHGDLTSYSTKENKTVFTSEAKDKISTQSWGGGDLTGQSYDASATYYCLSGYDWVKIEDNKAYFNANSSLLKEITVDVDFSTKLAQTITSGNFETVKFENNSSSNALTINSDIIGKILFIEKSNYGLTWEEINEKLKELDLGQAICTDLSSETFSTTNRRGTANLTTLTLPLTVKTSVKSELTSTMVEKMVLPSEVLGNYYPDITTVTIPEGYDRLGDNAFLNRDKISTFNLPSTLTLIGKAAFKSCKKITSIKLNNGLQNIGKEAFVGTQLTSIDFPSSLRIIDDAAFFECKIFNLKLNAGLQYIGNAAFGLLGNDNAEKTLEIPASVRYIGPFAFALHYFQDVFFYGEKAPIMPVGTSSYITDQGKQAAFSANTYMGNNGFNSGSNWEEGDIFDNAYNDGYANRENYKNGGVYFTMLHYPKELNDAQRAAYTDITRVYKTAEGNQKFCYGKNDNPDSYVKVGEENEDLAYGGYDAPKDCCFGYQDTYLGHQYVWPSQEQWRRSYVVNALGYNWDGKIPYRSKLSGEDIAILSYAGFKEGTGKGEYKRDELEKIAHLGTRMFVLSNADVNEDKEPEKEPEYPVNVKGGEWWTLCLPFNMTKAMVDETFGKDTQVCLFDRVKRQVNRNTKKNRIVLYFTQNVYKHKTEPKNADGSWNFQETAPAPTDDEIVIYAHESYMIHPTKTGEDAVFAVKNYQPVVGNPTPTVVMGKNEYFGESDTPDNVPYRYVGNYLENVDAQTANQSVDAQALQEVKIPKYSYVYASDGKETKFWFLTSDDMTWKPNKCVVQTNTRGDGQNDYEEFFDYTVSSAKQSSFFGEDFIDTPTSIEDEMVIIAGEGSDAPVYSLDGTLVNTTGDLTGLPKGVYIKGGKKYVVK
nr:leucine-rich repeat domain-containing protein [Prevotella sp.]